MLRPESEDDLAEAVAGASGPLAVQGGATRITGVDGEVLSTAGLSGISLYEPGSLTIVVGAGTPMAKVDAALEAEGQRLAFEPMDHRGLLATRGVPTIGGVVAGNVSGPRRVAVGAARDFLLGVRFIDGRGRIIKNGGRVMKNVTGYDLVKLLAGSFGTLGVLSEVALKVLPRPEVTASLMLHWPAVGASDVMAIGAMAAALGSPCEVTGAAHLPPLDAGRAITLIRVEGPEASVSYRLGKLQGLLGKYGDLEIVTDWQRVDAQWRSVRDVEAWWGSPHDIWRLSVKPSDAPEIVAQMPKATRVFYDWGGGLIWAACTAGTDLRATIRGFSGHATLVRAADIGRSGISRFHPEAAPIADITAGLRAKFDPRGILNSGLMG